ncbi:hypothetical protein TNCV_3307701 [Trichonephila clavipes]|nr:hypothetical protein TNCV_3307701 [Trichonephila clavipes]
MSLSSFRVQQDATGHQSIASTEKVTNTYRGVATVGCRCHRSACTKTRPDSRVVPRRKKGDEHPTPRVRGSMSLSSFRVHQDATGQQSSASTEKVTNTHRRADAAGWRYDRSACTKTRPDSGVGPRRKKVTNTHRRASSVGCRCHRSACNKTRTDSRVLPRRKK